MLYVFLGEREHAFKKLRSVRDALLKKRPEAESFKIDEDSLADHDLSALAYSQGLFEKKYIVTLDAVFAEGDADPDFVEPLARSENAFLVFEESPTKKLRSLLVKHADDTFDARVAQNNGKTFSAFTLADALGNRDKKKLWVLFREAVTRGYAMEEIHGILFWQAKMIVIAHETSSAEEAGVKQFPYSKARKFTKHFSLEESKALLSSLTHALVVSREENISLEHTLERVILRL